MSTLTISMPDSLREFIDHRVSTSGYGNTSEYVRELVRRDREAMAKAQLEAELLKGLEGQGIPSDDFWMRVDGKIAAQRAQKKIGGVK